MKAYDEDAKYILFINKSITILGCSTVNSLTIDFLGHISLQHGDIQIFPHHLTIAWPQWQMISKPWRQDTQDMDQNRRITCAIFSRDTIDYSKWPISTSQDSTMMGTNLRLYKIILGGLSEGTRSRVSGLDLETFSRSYSGRLK